MVMDQMQIADYLAKKMFNREFRDYVYYIMLKNKQIYSEGIYGKLVESYKISPEDAFVYIDQYNNSEDESYNLPVKYLFPLANSISNYGIVGSYLSKLGFYNRHYDVYPAMGLKYYVLIVLFSDRLVIELTDFNTMVTNTRLGKIVADMLGKDILTQTQKEIKEVQIDRIVDKLREQKIFAGHNWGEVYNIIKDYYMRHNTSLAKEVLSIANAYNQIFQPYRVVYDTTTRRQVLM
jgi:hypothetical protein